MARLKVEVVFAQRERQEVVLVELEEGARAVDAIRESRLGSLYPWIGTGSPRIGVFGQVVALETPLRDGDRVEIYRPLCADPKAARRAKAKQRRPR